MVLTNCSYSKYKCWFNCVLILVINLGLNRDIALEWTNYIVRLRHIGIRHGDEEDVLICSWNKKLGKVNGKDAYESINIYCVEIEPKWWYCGNGISC